MNNLIVTFSLLDELNNDLVFIICKLKSYMCTKIYLFWKFKLIIVIFLIILNNNLSDFIK